MNWHLLKITPENFEANLSGAKKNETRVNDRDYNLGDVLVLREYSLLRYPGDCYSGRVAIYRVTHITYTKDLPKPRDKAVMDVEWVVMSIEPWNENEAIKKPAVLIPQFSTIRPGGIMPATTNYKTAHLGPGCV